MKKLYAAVLATALAFSPVNVFAEGESVNSPTTGITDYQENVRDITNSNEKYSFIAGTHIKEADVEQAKEIIKNAEKLVLRSEITPNAESTYAEGVKESFEAAEIYKFSKNAKLKYYDISAYLDATDADGKVHTIAVDGLNGPSFEYRAKADEGWKIVSVLHYDKHEGRSYNIIGSDAFQEDGSVVFKAWEYSPYALVLVPTNPQTTTTEDVKVVVKPTTSTASTSSSNNGSDERQPEIANKSLVAGMAWEDANGSYTSLGDGRYYNQFNTVFNGEGTVVGKYNPATGVVSALATNTVNSTVANGTYTVPNTAAK